MEKKLTYLAILLLFPINIIAQSIPDELFKDNNNFHRYYEGCIKIMEGERFVAMGNEVGAKEVFAQAMTLLNQNKPNPWSTKQGINITALQVDTLNSSNLIPTTGHIIYCYAYARMRYENNQKDVSLGILRAGYSSDCRVLDIAIAPNGIGVFQDSVIGDCLLMAVAEYCGSVHIKAVDIESGIEFDGKEYDEDAVSFVNWTFEDKAVHTVNYIVENTSDKAISISLVAN